MQITSDLDFHGVVLLIFCRLKRGPFPTKFHLPKAVNLDPAHMGNVISYDNMRARAGAQ
jgi:hypothetical protein